MTITPYVARRALLHACARVPVGGHEWTLRPCAVGEDAHATDGKAALMLVGLAKALALPDGPPVVLLHAAKWHTSLVGWWPLGRCGLVTLARWCGLDDQRVLGDGYALPSPHPGLIADAVYDRQKVAQVIDVLSLAMPNDPLIDVWMQAEHNVLRLVGPGWSAAVMPLASWDAPWPGEETRLLLEDVPCHV